MRTRVAIVGGGPAGLATALFLAHARGGRCNDFVVLERDPYPREKICAGAVGGRALRLLERIGVTVDAPQAPFDTLRVRYGEGATDIPRARLGVVVRRAEFDHALARAARARGITILEGTRVTRVEAGDAEVTVHREGAVPIHADVVVGADGIGRVVRRSLGLGMGSLRAQAVEVDTPPAPDDPPRNVVQFDFRDRGLAGYAWDFPTIVDGRPLVCRGIYALRRRPPSPRDPAVDVTGLLAARLARQGFDIGALRVKRFAERGVERGAALARPRVLLVGEAAGIDIMLGEGIAQAIEYGAAAGPYLARRLARAGDAFDFRDFRRAIGRTWLGVETAIRRATVPWLYDRMRPFTERFILRHPGLLALPVARFAGAPLPWATQAWNAALFVPSAAWARLRGA